MDTDRPKPKRLNARQRAQLFASLQNSQSMPEGWDQLFKWLWQGQRAAEQAEDPAMAKQMAEGQGMVMESLNKSGAFLPWELSVMQLGLRLGNIQPSFQRLQLEYQTMAGYQQRFWRHQSRQVGLVSAITVLSYFMLAALSAISPLTAAVAAMLSILLVGTVVSLLAYLALRSLNWPSGKLSRLHWRRFPLWRRVSAAKALLHYFQNISQAIAAETSLAKALGLAADHMPVGGANPIYDRVAEQVGAGERLSTAIAENKLLLGVQVAAINRAITGPQDALAHLTEAVELHVMRQLIDLQHRVGQIAYLLLAILALLQWAVLAL